jgi:hypothetical protein
MNEQELEPIGAEVEAVAPEAEAAPQGPITADESAIIEALESAEPAVQRRTFEFLVPMGQISATLTLGPPPEPVE